MIILGIDPGIATVGWGVIEYNKNRFEVKDYSAIITPPKDELSIRLKSIFEALTGIIKTHSPDFVAVEELFFNTNQKTAITVGQGRGVCVLSASVNQIPVFEYTPLQVKQAVVGYGRADKTQVQHMVKAILNLNAVPKPDDVADALAIAICHAHSYSLNDKIGLR